VRKLIIYGNCQAGAVSLLLQTVPAIVERWEIVLHDQWATGEVLAKNLADFEDADILLQQDIWTWRNHPLRDNLPASLKVVKFPFCYVAVLWPFDAWLIGNDEAMLKALRAHQAASSDPFPFPFQDGLLAKLRSEIPDPVERFERYRSLDLPDIQDFGRYAEFEEGRLGRDDRRLGFTIGKFMIDNYRTMRLFHACVHPTAVLIEHLTAEIMARIGVDPETCPFSPRDDHMRWNQVPVHPLVIEKLEITWADELTLYMQQNGKSITFDEYFRSYVNYA
jgi:Polysaccharide biosynthesis enzyme WcbI